VVAIGRRERASLGHDAISIPILRNGHIVLARRAEPREDDRQPNPRGQQRHRLQRAGLVASDRTGIPQIYRLGLNGQFRRWKLPVDPISSDRDDDRSDHCAEGHRGYKSVLPLTRAISLPEDKQPTHARGTVCRVLDSRV
jgi:hypothetical protein